MCDTRDLDQSSSKQLALLFTNNTEYGASMSFSKQAPVHSISVHFHVIGRSREEQTREVSDEALVEQIDVLNRAYSGDIGGVDTPFRFTLGSINHVNQPAWRVIEPGSKEESSMKGSLRVGDVKSLNVYITDIVPPKDQNIKGKILGFSTFPFTYRLKPEMDGIVLNYRAVPGSDVANYNTGHVLVHESGHWLGLLHTFTGGCEGPIDDLISDTPREAPPTPGAYCPVDRDSCPGNPGIDPVHNHMDYTGDSCRTEFTPGQVAFMRFNTLLFRGFR
jgi:hypothetical protein